VLDYTSKSNGQRIDVVVELLRKFGDLQVLSSPRIMALNNQPAVLKVVENVVYFEIDVEPGIATGNTQSIPAIETTAKTVPVGLVMTVTPQVNENQSVTLNMRPTISSITKSVPDPSPDLAVAGTTNLVPQIQVREMESVLKVQNGQIAVLGGLIQDSVRRTAIASPCFRICRSWAMRSSRPTTTIIGVPSSSSSCARSSSTTPASTPISPATGRSWRSGWSGSSDEVLIRRGRGAKLGHQLLILVSAAHEGAR
jgi:type II/III secretion system protein